MTFKCMIDIKELYTIGFVCFNVKILFVNVDKMKNVMSYQLFTYLKRMFNSLLILIK